MIEKYDGPVRCFHARGLFAQEERARDEATREPDHSEAVRLAQTALNFQRQRHHHEETCTVCGSEPYIPGKAVEE